LESAQAFMIRVISTELTLHTQHITVCGIKHVRTFKCYNA